MREVGILEAKTNLSALIESLEAGGEDILITRHGRPAALLSSAPIGVRPPADLAEQIRAFRAGVEERQGVDSEFDWKGAVEQGRE